MTSKLFLNFSINFLKYWTKTDIQFKELQNLTSNFLNYWTFSFFTDIISINPFSYLSCSPFNKSRNHSHSHFSTARKKIINFCIYFFTREKSCAESFGNISAHTLHSSVAESFHNILWDLSMFFCRFLYFFFILRKQNMSQKETFRREKDNESGSNWKLCFGFSR